MKYRPNKKITKRADKMLTKLADFLENDVRDRMFDLGIFWDETGRDVLEDDLYNCGTTACACGWAAVSPKFRGLVTESHGNIYHKKSDTSDLEAAGNYFSITKAQADYLFDPSYYRSGRSGRKSVVNRIRKFVKDGCVKGRGGDTADWLEEYADE